MLPFSVLFLKGSKWARQVKIVGVFLMKEDKISLFNYKKTFTRNALINCRSQRKVNIFLKFFFTKVRGFFCFCILFIDSG